ncbi:MAG: CsbD family protein [Actinomycetota bacterium]|nr:CsbD family protein [Actinomycetota bacterium]
MSESTGSGNPVERAAEHVKGKTKEVAGTATGDESLRKEGRAEQEKAAKRDEAAQKEAEAARAREEARDKEAEVRQHQP